MNQFKKAISHLPEYRKIVTEEKKDRKSVSNQKSIKGSSQQEPK
jgi:hypothetical protein